ncbi:hypothetical protein F5Y14DRAFT_461194 [Nemania sp. NC0429]|nr:hypothetical protein F5Y14DRAFT_461194 [Nemania sp. NC0429]
MKLIMAFIMRWLAIGVLATTLATALPGSLNMSTSATPTKTKTKMAPKLLDDAVIFETIPVALDDAPVVSSFDQFDINHSNNKHDNDNKSNYNAATRARMAMPARPSRTIIPDWISPPFDPNVDRPVVDEATDALLATYHADAPRNNIPERVMAGPSARSNRAPSNDGGTRQIMFHQDAIFSQFRWGAEIFRSMMLNPQNVGPNHPGLAQNGEIWPRQMRQGGHLVPSATGGGELDLYNDLILEFPFGESYSYFGTDFANVNPPNRAPRRHIPSNHLLIFGYHRQDTALQRPLYIGMVTREGFGPTSRTNWHWCPVVNYDGTPGPARNLQGHPWQGVNPTFRLGVIAYFLRDWLINTPFVKQPRRHLRRAEDGGDDVGYEDYDGYDGYEGEGEGEGEGETGDYKRCDFEQQQQRRDIDLVSHRQIYLTGTLLPSEQPEFLTRVRVEPTTTIFRAPTVRDNLRYEYVNVDVEFSCPNLI